MASGSNPMNEQEILYKIKESLDNPQVRSGVEILSESELAKLSGDEKTQYYMSLLQGPNKPVRNL